MLSFEELLKKIGEGSEHSMKDIEKMVKDKQTELSGLVSREGAAYIVGRELGVDLIQEGERRLKIKNLVSGLMSVEVVARVGQIYDVRKFEKDGREGQVLNLLIGDETGSCRLSLWNDEVNLIGELNIKEGDVVEVKGGYVKIDNMGNPELRLGRGSLKKSKEKVELPPADKIEFSTSSAAPGKLIKDLREGDFAETKAVLVQIFQRNPFYEVCPTCGARIYQKDGKWTCEEHGEVEPAFNLVASGVIDDGTGNIRAVFFRDTAQKVLGKDVKKLQELAEKGGSFEVLYEDLPSLGKDFIFKGRVKHSDFTDRDEFIVNEMEEIDVKSEIEGLLEEMGGG